MVAEGMDTMPMFTQVYIYVYTYIYIYIYIYMLSLKVDGVNNQLTYNYDRGNIIYIPVAR